MNKINFKERKVVKTFDEQAKIYAGLYKGYSSGAYAFRIRRKRVYELLKNCKGKKVLDIGCGPGIMVNYLVNKGFEFYGVDISKKMIKECKNKFKSLKSAHFSVGRIENLRFPDSFFDIIICMGVVEYIANDVIAIREMARVVKPGGVVIITIPNKLSPYRIWEKYIYDPVANIIKKLIGFENKTGLIHRKYTERAYSHLLNSYRLKVIDTAYYDFRLLFYPLNRLFPKLEVLISRTFEPLHRSKLQWLGTGFIVKAIKK